MREAAAFVAGQQSRSSGLLAPITDAITRVYRHFKHRRAVMYLSDMDDHVLRDIGLTPADVDVALSRPFSEDPSAELQRIALGNRARWRSV